MQASAQGTVVTDAAKLQMLNDVEMELISDLYRRLTKSCRRKCIPPKHRDYELTKGESVCLDRCVAKFMDLHERVGKRLTSIYAQDEETLKKLQEQQMQASENKQ